MCIPIANTNLIRILPIVIPIQKNRHYLSLHRSLTWCNLSFSWINYFDRFGFIRQSEIIVSEESYDRDFSSSQIEQITLHELGHVLGLEHANFRGNLMTERVDIGSTTISSCEIQAVNIANSWKINGGNTMYLPQEKYIEC